MQASPHQPRSFLFKSVQALQDMNGTFRDRAHAGRLMIEWGVMQGEPSPYLIASTPGGLVVAEEMARISKTPVSFARVQELEPPWPAGPIVGAVAFDGTLVVDEVLRDLCSVTRDDFRRLIDSAFARISSSPLQGVRSNGFPSLRERTAIIVDDGLAGPLTLRVVVALARNAGARRVVLSLPVGHRRMVKRLSEAADLTYCASLRSSRGDLAAAYALVPCEEHAARGPGLSDYGSAYVGSFLPCQPARSRMPTVWRRSPRRSESVAG